MLALSSTCCRWTISIGATPHHRVPLGGDTLPRRSAPLEGDDGKKRATSSRRGLSSHSRNSGASSRYLIDTLTSRTNLGQSDHNRWLDHPKQRLIGGKEWPVLVLWEMFQPHSATSPTMIGIDCISESGAIDLKSESKMHIGWFGCSIHIHTHRTAESTMSPTNPGRMESFNLGMGVCVLHTHTQCCTRKPRSR
jgi:hypothetical protein